MKMPISELPRKCRRMLFFFDNNQRNDFRHIMCGRVVNYKVILAIALIKIMSEDRVLEKCPRCGEKSVTEVSSIAVACLSCGAIWTDSIKLYK